MSDCIFCKIIAGEIPAKIVFEDDVCFAFHDIDPQAPTHVLLIPREHIASLDELGDSNSALMGHIVTVAARLAKELGVADSGYRLVANCNADGGQVVFHIHFHLLGGRKLTWPPG